MVPPGGWAYTDPDTGLGIFADGPGQLQTKINAHRLYKGLPPITRQGLEEYFTAKSAPHVVEAPQTG